MNNTKCNRILSSVYIGVNEAQNTKRGKNIMKNKNYYRKMISGIVALTMMVIGCGAGLLMMTGCGTSDSDVADTESAESQTYEDQADDSSSNVAEARLELDDYECRVESPRNVKLRGTINHSYGQDIVALKGNEEEVARVSLKGNNGDEERFEIVIPASALTNEHNAICITGAELPGKVHETYYKVFTISVGNQ